MQFIELDSRYPRYSPRTVFSGDLGAPYYKKLCPYWDAEAQRKVMAGRHPLRFDNLTAMDGHAEHKQIVACLAKKGSPAVVLAESGMGSGGRILN